MHGQCSIWHFVNIFLHFSKGLLKSNVFVGPSVVPGICTCRTTTLTPVYWTEISVFSGISVTRYEPWINSHANKHVFWIWKPDDKAEYICACVLTVWLPKVIINNYNSSQSLSVVAYLPSCTSLFKYANLWQQNISVIKYEDGWHDTTSSLYTKMKKNSRIKVLLSCNAGSICSLTLEAVLYYQLPDSYDGLRTEFSC